MSACQTISFDIFTKCVLVTAAPDKQYKKIKDVPNTKLFLKCFFSFLYVMLQYTLIFSQNQNFYSVLILKITVFVIYFTNLIIVLNTYIL